MSSSSSSILDRLLTPEGASAAVDALPMIVLCGHDTDALLAAASRIVALSSHTVVDDPFAGPREVVELVIPGGDWGVGRRVTVERRFSPSGAMLARVPEQVGGKTPSSTAEETTAPSSSDSRCGEPSSSDR
jgi:hypothetical protein